MTPRQKKRLVRVHAKGIPLHFIRFRAVHARFSAAVDMAIKDIMQGRRSAVEAVRNHVRDALCEVVLRPVVRSMVRQMVEALS